MGKGFQTLPRERVEEIGRMGGKAAHAKGTAHRFTPEEAKAAGRKGAAVRRANYERRKKEEADTLPAPPDGLPEG